MKKKLFLLTFMLALFIPCAMLLVACGNDTTYKVNLPNSDTGDAEILLYDVGSGNFEDGSGGGGFQEYVKKGKSASYEIWMRNIYDAKTLKIYANGEELAISGINDVDQGDIVNENRIKVGSITCSNIQSNIKITYDIEERNIDFKFVAAPYNEIYGSAPQFTEALHDLKIKGTSNSLNYYINNPDQSVKVKYSDFVNKGLTLTSSKHAGYYKFVNFYDTFQAYFIGNESKSYIQEVFGYNSKDYSVKLDFDSGVKTLNTVTVNPWGVGVFEGLSYNSPSGNIVQVKVGGEIISPGTNFPCNAGTLEISLQEHPGVDFTGAKVFINNEEITLNAQNKYSFDIASRMPVSFGKDKFDIIYSVQYYIEVKLAENAIQQVEGHEFFILTQDYDNPLSSYDFYYCDENSYYYDIDSQNAKANLPINANQPIPTQTLYITANIVGENTPLYYTLSLEALFNDPNTMKIDNGQTYEVCAYVIQSGEIVNADYYIEHPDEPYAYYLTLSMNGSASDTFNVDNITNGNITITGFCGELIISSTNPQG